MKNTLVPFVSILYLISRVSLLAHLLKKPPTFAFGEIIRGLSRKSWKFVV
jgi:hypothetical protein